MFKNAAGKMLSCLLGYPSCIMSEHKGLFTRFNLTTLKDTSKKKRKRPVSEREKDQRPIKTEKKKRISRNPHYNKTSKMKFIFISLLTLMAHQALTLDNRSIPSEKCFKIWLWYEFYI